MSVCSCGDSGGNTAVTRVESDVDLIVVEVGARDQNGSQGADLVSVGVLRVHAFLQTGIVLLKGVAIYGIVQEVREVRVEVEQGAGEESIRLQRAADSETFAVVSGKSAELDPAPVARVQIAKSVALARRQQ